MNKPTDLQGLVLDPIAGDQRYTGHIVTGKQIGRAHA